MLQSTSYHYWETTHTLQHTRYVAQRSEHGCIGGRQHRSNVGSVVEVWNRAKLVGFELQQGMVGVGVGDQRVPQRLVARLRGEATRCNLGCPNSSYAPCVARQRTLFSGVHVVRRESSNRHRLHRMTNVCLVLLRPLQHQAGRHKCIDGLGVIVKCAAGMHVQSQGGGSYCGSSKDDTSMEPVWLHSETRWLVELTDSLQLTTTVPSSSSVWGVAWTSDTLGRIPQVLHKHVGYKSYTMLYTGQYTHTQANITWKKAKPICKAWV